MPVLNQKILINPELSYACMKFMLLINVKMPTIVGILTFISRINAAFQRFKARILFIFHHFTFYEQSKFHAQLN